MKSIIYLTLTILIIPFLGYSQTDFKFDIYDNKGKLKQDSSIAIPSGQLNIWKISGQEILSYIMADIQYSDMAKDAGIVGTAIATFDFNIDTITKIELLKNLGGGLDENIINSIKNNRNLILKTIQNACSTLDESDCEGTFYVPFEFKLSRQELDSEKRDLIQVIGIETPLNGCK